MANIELLLLLLMLKQFKITRFVILTFAYCCVWVSMNIDVILTCNYTYLMRFQNHNWHAHGLKLKIVQYNTVRCAQIWVQRKIMHRQVVVNAQFEDRIRARICAGDSLKRAGLFIHSLKMAKKRPNGDQRLPYGPVFWVLESQLTRPEYRSRKGRRQVWTP